LQLFYQALSQVEQVLPSVHAGHQEMLLPQELDSYWLALGFARQLLGLGLGLAG
jgi:hypothetical protein